MKIYRTPDGGYRYWKILRHLLFLVLVIGAAYFGSLYRQVDQSVETIHQPVKIQPKREVQANIKEGEPINVLLLGLDADERERDESEGYVARSDSMIVMTLNPKEGLTQLVSIPRDTIVTIKGIDYPDKINHAYAFGGEELAIDAVQEFLQIPIDFYMSVNMSGLEELIDAIGGVEITSPLTFEYRGTQFKEGETRHLNGVKAMNFARMRYDDPEGEIGRQKRQKLVIKAMIDQALSLDIANKLPELIRVASKYVRTDFDLDHALDLYRQYRSAFKKIETVTFQDLEEVYIGNGFYFYVPQGERRRMSNAIRRVAELDRVRLADLKDPLEGDEGLTSEARSHIQRGQEASPEVHDPAPAPAHPYPSRPLPGSTPTPPAESTGPASSSSSSSSRPAESWSSSSPSGGSSTYYPESSSSSSSPTPAPSESVEESVAPPASQADPGVTEEAAGSDPGGGEVEAGRNTQTSPPAPSSDGGGEADSDSSYW